MNIQCHCGNIVLDAALPAQLTDCNCSICRRYAALWGYYHPDDVDITVGAGGEVVYCWGDRELEFVRCGVCACVTHYRTVAGQPAPRIAINFRLVADTLIGDIPRRLFDGATLL